MIDVTLTRAKAAAYDDIIPGNGQISTKMHGISLAAWALPQTPLWGLISPHAPSVIRGGKERGRGRGPQLLWSLAARRKHDPAPTIQ